MNRIVGSLVLLPVLLLTVIARFGLVEYRHSVTAEARSLAEEWSGRGPGYLKVFNEELEERRPIQLYEELPVTVSMTEGVTETGVPTVVLDAWEVSKKSGTRADAERAAVLAIYEFPSAISGPLVAALVERFPDSDWQRQWHESEERRAILRAHPGVSGFVTRPEGPAMIEGGRVLTPTELRAIARRIRDKDNPPEWMNFDLVGAGKSMLEPIETPLVSGGDSLRVEIGIGDSRILYAQYWRTAWGTALGF